MGTPLSTPAQAAHLWEDVHEDFRDDLSHLLIAGTFHLQCSQACTKMGGSSISREGHLSPPVQPGLYQEGRQFNQQRGSAVSCSTISRGAVPCLSALSAEGRCRVLQHDQQRGGAVSCSTISRGAVPCLSAPSAEGRCRVLQHNQQSGSAVSCSTISRGAVLCFAAQPWSKTPESYSHRGKNQLGAWAPSPPKAERPGGKGLKENSRNTPQNTKSTQKILKIQTQCSRHCKPPVQPLKASAERRLCILFHSALQRVQQNRLFDHPLVAFMQHNAVSEWRQMRGRNRVTSQGGNWAEGVGKRVEEAN